jgi:predicted glycosyltransferase
LVKKFDCCWIPDIQAAPGLSGDLAHPKKMPTTPYWYMGLLSRIEGIETKEPINKNNEIEFLGIVSGPEPQRSIFEKQLWEQGNSLGKKFVVVAGIPNNPSYNKSSSFGSLYHHLSVEELVQKIQVAKFIICRGGYTSLMELAAFNKSLILVPTPGQTEQIYLAKHWVNNNWANSVDAEGFDLKNVLENAKQNAVIQIPQRSFSANGLAAAVKALTL